MEVILYVEDMDAQVSFYRDKLGLNVKSPQDTENYSEEFWVELDSGPCTLALHAGGKRRFGEVLALQGRRSQVDRTGVSQPGERVQAVSGSGTAE